MRSSRRLLCRLAWPNDLVLPPITAAADVRNPLLGPRGATRTFGRQKGAKPEQIEILERALTRLANVAARASRDLRDFPGAGAAGGLGFGLLAFCGAELRPGFEVVAEVLDLRREILRADYVITGEGSLDRQMLEGKAPAGVARIARKLGKPAYAIVGQVSDDDEVHALFDGIIPLDERFGPSQIPSGTAILGGIATISGDHMVTAGSFIMCTVVGRPSDGTLLMDSDRPSGPLIISFSQPVSAFGAYWGSGLGCYFGDSPSILTFQDINGKIIGTDSFLYHGDGTLLWRGYAFSTPVKTITRIAGDGEEGVAMDGLQATVASSGSSLGNLSTRMRVLTGDNVPIAGFIITGSDAKKIIVRGSAHHCLSPAR